MDYYSQHESLVLNESHQTKRDSENIADDAKNEENKSKRKRRSSLASSRRSITISRNDPLSKDECSSDLPSSNSSSASSQPLKEKQGTILKPNPLNVQMDEIIKDFEESISRLNQERTQWKIALKNLEKEQEQTNLLSEGNVSILPDDIPQDLKDIAKSEYMSDLIDFQTMSTKVEKGLLKSYFDIQKCLQDMKLFRGTVNTVKCHNKYVKTPLSLTDDGNFDDIDDVNMDTSEGKASCNLLTDIKSQLEWMMNN